MNEQNLRPIEELPKIEEPKKNINLTDLKKSITTTENPEDLIAKLPEWSIEPPLEINRGQK